MTKITKEELERLKKEKKSKSVLIEKALNIRQPNANLIQKPNNQNNISSGSGTSGNKKS